MWGTRKRLEVLERAVREKWDWTKRRMEEEGTGRRGLMSRIVVLENQAIEASQLNLKQAQLLERALDKLLPADAGEQRTESASPPTCESTESEKPANEPKSIYCPTCGRGPTDAELWEATR